MDRAWTGIGQPWTGIGQSRSAAGGAAVYNLRLPPKASGKDTGAGPAPGFKRLRATAGQGPNYVAHFVAMLAYVGLSCGQCGPILWLCWPMLASGWFMLSQKIRKMVTAKKNTVKRRIFWWSAAYLGAMLAHLGAMWAYLGAMLAHLGAMLAHLGAMLAHLGAMLAHLGAMLAHLGAMLAHLEAYVGPSWGLSWPMLTHLKPQDPKNGKKGEEHKTP